MVNYPSTSHTAATDEITVHTASSLSGLREAGRPGKGGETTIPHSPWESPARAILRGSEAKAKAKAKGIR